MLHLRNTKHIFSQKDFKHYLNKKKIIIKYIDLREKCVKLK